ncbi:hypothetical protein [Sphingomonas cavernae]|uniref:Uncharacterized protein n=1 Tax=Sphingomonas cavernae TaxID=2320861 RepID=A0A418WPF1_9SPHN|nr:hypothetical protein [Sphingomonas cavernae]RJF93094.1 hypothetical protein D3876_01615 [Sphingomonas cavernae]
MTLVLTLLLLAQPTQPPTEEVTVESVKAEFCGAVTRQSEANRAKWPMKQGKYTTWVGFEVSCADRTITTVDTYDADVSSLKVGWRELLQAQWEKRMCDPEDWPTMKELDWTLVRSVTFRSGENVQFRTQCENLPPRDGPAQ